jgi:hypothetical protein
MLTYVGSGFGSVINWPPVAACSLWRAGGFSGSLKVLHGDQNRRLGKSETLFGILSNLQIRILFCESNFETLVSYTAKLVGNSPL